MLYETKMTTAAPSQPDAAQPIEELRRQDEELDEHKKILRAKKFSPSFVGLHTALPLFFYNRADNYFL